MSINVSATMARRIAVVLLVMFLFGRPVVQGSFVNTLPFSRSQIKKSTRVKTVDKGSRSSLDISLSPEKLFNSSKAHLNI
jgi:hypothetical protein